MQLTIALLADQRSRQAVLTFMDEELSIHAGRLEANAGVADGAGGWPILSASTELECAHALRTLHIESVVG